MKIAILGAGLEGMAIKKHLTREGFLDITVLDQKENPKAFDDLDSYDEIYRSPGIPLRSEFLKTVSSKLRTGTQEFFDKCPAKIIGVTGTKGKGTCSTLIAEGLRLSGKTVHLLGNIGLPALDVLPKIKKDELVVFELSSFQLEDLHKSPNYSVVLNISADHLDHHRSLENYRVAKRAILAYQGKEDKAWINADYFGSFDFGRFGDGEKIMYSVKSQSRVCIGDHNGESWIFVEGEAIVAVKKIQIRGAHHLENILPASAVLKCFGVSNECIETLLMNFKGLEYRLEEVHESEGVRYFNDSISTNPETVLAAAKSFVEPVFLMMGGKNKGLDFTGALEKIEEMDHIKKILLFGEMGQEIAALLKKKAFVYEEKIESLLLQEKHNFKAGDCLVFSPGGASFDAYKNYKDRGAHFNEIVKQF